VVVSLVVSSLCCLGLVAALMVWPACSPAHLGPLALSVLAFLAFSSGLHLSALIGVANRLPRQYRGAILLGMVSDKTGKTTYLVSSVAIRIWSDPKPLPDPEKIIPDPDPGSPDPE
jgi:hypothetical protein